MPNIKILVADDHPIFIEGIANALRRHPRYKIAGTASNGEQAIMQAEILNPDIVLLDINMPGNNGLEVLHRVKRTLPSVKVVLVTMYLPADLQFDPDLQPTDGYVLKNSGTEVLLEALNTVMSGKRYFDPAIQRKNDNHSSDSFARQAKLSGREKEILKLILEGFTNQQIAARLFLSELTIKTHRKNIMQKMDAHNLADLLLKARS